MGMQSEGGKRIALVVEMIKEDKWLKYLTQIAGTHQSRDVAMGDTARAVDDVANGIGGKRNGERHGGGLGILVEEGIGLGGSEPDARPYYLTA